MLNKLVFLNAVALVLYYEIAKAIDLGNDEKCTSVCSSKECREKAKFLIANIDQISNPCDNFYQFACGNYIKHGVIAEDKVSANQFGTAQERLNKNLIQEIKTKVLLTDLEYVKKLKIHYKNCLDTAEIERVDALPLLDLINRLGGWPVLLGDGWKEEDYRWEDLVSNISKEGFRPGFPINLFVELDSTNSQRFSIHITPVDTAINDVTDDKFMEAYQAYLVEVAVLLGASRDSANTQMKDLVEFDKQLLEAQLPRDEVDDVSPLENRKAISALSKEYPDLPWLEIINRILSPSNVTVTEDEFVQIHDPRFMSEIRSLIKNTPKRVLANYQIFEVIDNFISFLSEKFLKVQLNFLKKTIGLKRLPKREKFCFNEVRDPFHIALGSLYVKKYFNLQSKHVISNLFGFIERAYEISLEKINWIDDNTRTQAHIKLEAIESLEGYPDELFDNKKIERYYENMEITPGNFFGDIQKISTYSKNFNFNKLRKPAKQFEWMSNADVATVNTFYNVRKNEISIVAGILQEPFFNPNWPDYLSYGVIGYIIGHEITHAFDYRGRKYDREGNFKDWWNNKTVDEFERKVQCQVEQYNNYSVKQIDKKINGKLTKGENIADAIGIKLAYHGYERFLNYKIHYDKELDGCLPNLNYTPKQMFWISAATIWCEKITDEALKVTIVGDSHSPPEARVNVVFSNNEEFAKDFKCPAGSVMNPTKKCQVW